MGKDKVQLKDLMAKDKVQLKDLQSVIGKLQFSTTIVKSGKAFLSDLLI